MAFALICDGAGDESIRHVRDQIDPPARHLRLVDDAPVIDGVRWDPATWGTTPEAQANLAAALAFAGPPVGDVG